MDYAVANGLEASVDVEQIDGGVLIRIGGTLLFPSGRAELTAQSHELLGKIVELARPLVNEVRVEGHTDDLAPSNSPYSDNWQLSSARAVSVLQVLLAGGISADRLSATGYADARPLEPNNSPAARARNRRVEILLIYPEADSPFASPEDH
jgi:chemotaxis protein MotB